MKNTGYLFKKEMILGLVSGIKEQTRRLMKCPNWGGVDLRDLEFDRIQDGYKDGAVRAVFIDVDGEPIGIRCPHGTPGDRFHVKESAWMWCEKRPNGKTPTGRDKWHYVPQRTAQVIYQRNHPKKPELTVVSPDTGNEWGWRLKIGRFLPKWACCLRGTILNIGAQRLQDIGAGDAIREGIERVPQLGVLRSSGWRDYSGETAGFMDPRESYRTLWDMINTKPGTRWADNPWVWVYTLELDEE